MKKTIPFLVFFLLVIFALAIVAEHAYVGLNRCKMCHKGDKNGMIFEKWDSTGHAQAYAVLGSDAAKEVYAKLGKSGNPQEDAACLKCHITGFGGAAEMTALLAKENGITCEACHGAGGDYWKKTIMEDRAAAIANGLIADPKKNCVNCHNEESPTFKPFNLEERWTEIEHKLPEETE